MKKHILIILTILAMVSLFFFSCTEETEQSLYDPNYKTNRSNPIITGVEPATGTFSGIGEVEIKGQNFSDIPEIVQVYFDGEPGTLMSLSDTLARVIVPKVSGDSVKIHLRVEGAMLFGEYSHYKIEVAERAYGGITDVSDAYGIACDNNENLFVSLGELRIVKITPEETMEDYVTNNQGVTSFFKSMKIGPAGKLYAARTKFFYEVPAVGDTINKITGRLSQAINDFDFDQNQNIFYAAKNGIHFLKSDLTDEQAADYTDYTFSALRVYNNFVYVAGKYTGTDTTQVQKGIWRNEIISGSGQLGANELVFDWETYYPGVQIGIPDILAITFADDGDLYVGSDSTTISNAITILHPDGNGDYLVENAEPLFDVLLIPPANNFCWGSDQFLYVNRRSNNPKEKRIIRVTMGKNSAPYYGRQ